VPTFAEEVVVEPEGEGRYRASLSHDWDLVPLPQGGVIAAFALRAAGMEVGEASQRLRTCTTVFAGQVSAGDLDVEVAVLRNGRTATQVMATVRNAGSAAGATVLAVFGAPRSGPVFVDVEPPKVPSPLDCPSYRDPPPPGVEPFPPLPFWERVEGRAAMGHAPWEQYEPEGSEVATWLRFDDPPLLDDGSVDPLAVLTLADRMPGCIDEKVGRDGPQWFAPSADITFHNLAPHDTEWLLAHDRAHWAGDGWASAQSTLWDENGRLIAFATQMMLFTYT
jgi:acyl-CoA thioesterase